MNWTNIKSDDTVNFRIQLQDTTVEVGDEVVVKVTATVPSYVAKTGEENIAWNSFAYSYQNPDILGDTVMVAEPAKVGVWVQTPDADSTIHVVKNLSGSENGGIFYFALFEEQADNTLKRVSDVTSLTLNLGETSGKMDMEHLNYADTEMFNGNNLYLYETNAAGEILDVAASKYTVTYNGGAGTDHNQINTAEKENTITITNTAKEVDAIKLTKTLAGENITGALTTPVWALPRSLATTGGIIVYFLFLEVLRCFSSLRSPPDIHPDDSPSDCRVVPFGNPWINGHLHLPRACRSLSRPSSPP